MERLMNRRWLVGCLMGGGLALLAALPIQAQVGGTAGRARTGGLSTEPRQYRSNTMLGDAIIQTDPETRSLVIITDQTTQEEISKVIQNLDRPKPQVLIKVLFIEVTHRKELDLGTQGTYTYTVNPTTGGLTGTDFGVDEITRGGFWTITSDNWNAVFRALARNGKLEVLSRPSILARNNQEAVIVVGEELPLVTNSRVTDQNAVINNFSYTQVGITLRVTPFITSEGSVEMIVNPEISTQTEQREPVSYDADGNVTATAPVIANRSVETVVVTDDGQTVVIGGLVQTIKAETVQKVPVLGDIPLLGWAFRRKETTDEKKELLIFLTPYIVRRPSEMTALSRAEATKMETMRKAFSPVDFEEYRRLTDSLDTNVVVQPVGTEPLR